MAQRTERVKRALYVGRVARRGRLLRVLRELGVWGNRPATREGAEAFRQALEELGTTYIKLGQLLSSRPDLLPDVYIEELGKLVDDVPPVPFDQIQRVMAEDLPADAFARIDPEPLATASIAQIHTALLTSGRDVIVKVRRPGIERQVALDLDLMRSTAGLLEDRSERAQLLQARALADELEGHLRGELDFVEEAGNAELVARLLESYEDLVVPAVIRPYVTEKVLVLERIHGRKVDAEHGLAPERARELARQFFRAYVHQVTVEGVYHADPHRGNVLLTTDGRLALVGVAPTDLAELEHAMRSVANRVGSAVIVASLLIASALLARVHDLRWFAFGGFCTAFVLGLYMVWKIIRTPGEL